jgi:hypothetical protein
MRITRRTPSLTRPRNVMFAVVLALAVGLAAIAPTSAHASSAGATGNSGGFWVTMTPGETFTQAVSRAAQESPGQVAAALNRMLEHQQAGQGVYIPQSRNGALVQVKASRSDLTGALAAAESTAAVAGSSRPKINAARATRARSVRVHRTNSLLTATPFSGTAAIQRPWNIGRTSNRTVIGTLIRPRMAQPSASPNLLRTPIVYTECCDH